MDRRSVFSLILFLLLSLGPLWAQAYPDMIRHNYSSCTACHFSPAGGGLLNPYGRTISKEVLSTWGTEKEAQPFYGVLEGSKLNSWLQVGGNIRALQLHHESDKVREGRTIPMQAGLEAAAQWGRWTVSFFFGKLNKDWKVEPEFIRYYTTYQWSDEWTLRLGRFTPIFGLNVPQHTLPTRGALGFGQNSERDSLEASWTGEKWSGSLTASKSVLTKQQPEVESGVSSQLNYTFADSYKFGMSYWLGAQESQHREVFSAHGSLGFTEHFYLLTETALQYKRPYGGKSQDGIFHFAKLGYEVFKGFHAQFVEEYSQSDFTVENSKMESFGPGFLFYPRPHFEFEFLYSKKKIRVMRDDFEDYAYLLMHYYF